MVRILIHPGEHLADELKALGMSANELAKELGVPTNRLTEIIRGKRGISGDTALRLGRWFGTGPDIWMNLQKNYELRLAAQEIGDALQKIPEHKEKAKTGKDLQSVARAHDKQPFGLRSWSLGSRRGTKRIYRLSGLKPRVADLGRRRKGKLNLFVKLPTASYHREPGDGGCAAPG